MSIRKNFDGKGLTSLVRTFPWCRQLPAKFLIAVVLCSAQASFAQSGVRTEGAKPNKNAWVHSGFEQFVQGQFEDGGSNLYVNAQGTIEMIHRWDVNDDGYVDLVLANSHDHIERGPTHVFKLDKAGEKRGDPKQLPNDSGWMSRIVDLDQDGFADLIVVNASNGATAVVPSYVYWGGPDGLRTERTDLTTVGAHDVAVIDINRDGRLDLIFPSAWTDHHNAGKPLPARVYLGGEDRQFEDATERYNIMCIASKSIAANDLNQDGYVDLVVANSRIEHDYNTESFVYWGTKEGLDVKRPLRLPTQAALGLCVADLNDDAMDDIIFSGGNQVRIYWNKAGKFERADHQVINVSGATRFLDPDNIHCDVADLDGDGRNDLVIGTKDGVQIRSGGDLDKIQTTLPLSHAQWVTACDLNNDGKKDLIVSRYQEDTSYAAKSAVFWNGPGGFSTERATWFPTNGAVGNTAGDLDGDERPEVVFNNTRGGHVWGIPSYIYLGNQDAKYGIERRIELPLDATYTAAVADLDLDGHPEVILAGSQHPKDEWEGCFRIYQGGPDGPVLGRFEDLMTNTNMSPQGIRVADFNRDGYLDLFEVTQVYDTKPETLAKSGAIHYGSKDGFSSSRKQPIEVLGNSAYVADVNKDGYLDLLCAEKRKQVLIYLGGEVGFAKDRTWKIPCPGLAGGTVNVADLNKDGWLDLIVSTFGHRVGLKDTLYIYFGSEEGYSLQNSQRYAGGYSPIFTGVADYNRDGNLDVVVTAYSSSTARVIPAQLFWGNGKRIDFSNPVNLPAMSSGDALQIDLNRDGWIDLFLVCHRTDIGHQVDSLIYWNSPEGFSIDDVTGLPGLGPHSNVYQNHGNAYTREPQETYVSPPYDMKGQTAQRIHWNAEVPPPSKLRFQLRWSATKEQLNQAQWMGPSGENTYFDESGTQVNIPARDAQWLQYQAIFVSPYGCRSPRLSEVRLDLKPR